MSIRLRSDAPLGDQLRGIVTAELGAASDELREPGALGVERTVHDVRTRLKRVRALLRLARPEMDGAARRADGDLRDAARALSPLRDAHALAATFEAAMATSRDDVPGADGVRAGLARRAGQVPAGEDLERVLTAAAERIAAVAGTAEGWTVGDGRTYPEIAMGDAYRRGRAALRACRAEPSDESLHEWRKAARRGREQARMLHELAPSALRPMAKALKRLGDALGDDHDLAVLRAELIAEGDPSSDAVVARIDAIRADLQDRALRLGERLYAERPDAFARRIAGYRRAMRRAGAERSVGTVARLSHDAADRPPAAVATAMPVG